MANPVKRATGAAGARPGNHLLVNIDNGGTLTDFCIIDGSRVHRTKSVTTPYDLSKCLFDGLRKASTAIYGSEDLQRLLLSAEHIRYSSTQGTNALVERKGQRLGLLLGGIKAADLSRDAQQKDVFAALVGNRVASLKLNLADEALARSATQAINQLAAAGANRIVVGVAGAQSNDSEKRLKRMLLQKFPPHLLGALPILYSHELVQDDNPVRRIWTALFNAFLHPAMEHFLYNAEHRLREHGAQNPLLIFRNDGDSARIARTTAVKTYSSGPRGGAEGSKALAAHYGFKRLVGMDVGGTTTDLSLVENNEVHTDRRGRIEGVETSLPLCNVVSAGVGGSSIIKVEKGKLKVGPESVGGAPGPACFALGGKEATITDALLLLGLLDPASYFGGELRIDVERARTAIEQNIARPLKLSVEQAAAAMEQAWVEKVAAALKAFTKITPDTTLAAFGGGGPMLACRVAEAAGISQVVIPGLAAVFSAFGVGFSDIAHEYEVALGAIDKATLKQAQAELLERARRGMFAEGFDLKDCALEYALLAGEVVLPFKGTALPGAARKLNGAQPSLLLKATKPIAQATLVGHFGSRTVAAKAAGKRRLLLAGTAQSLPVYQASQLAAGAQAQGPCVLEEAFFTGRVEAGWTFERNAAGDILLSRGKQPRKNRRGEAS